MKKYEVTNSITGKELGISEKNIEYMLNIYKVALSNPKIL